MDKDLIKIAVSFLLFIISYFIPIEYIKITILVISYLLVGLEVLKEAFENIKEGTIFDENFLMTIATIGAISLGEFHEAIAVMLLYQIGETFQERAVDKSKKSIKELMDIRSDYANLVKDNTTIKVDPNEVRIGDTIIIKPGEKIPLDGVVIEGNSYLETKALTGEPAPKYVEKDTQVLSGCINKDGLLKVKVTKKFTDSTVSKILALVENANDKKSSSEQFITKFARYYTPIVVVLAIILAFIPPIILQTNISPWLHRALSFLVISCPCALVISIPLSFFAGIGASSKIGVLIKGSNYLEALSNIGVVACDKTGTLTEGIFEIQNISPKDIEKEKLLELSAYAEYYSTHPIAVSIKNYYGKKIDEKRIKKVKEITGLGIKARIDNQDVLIGNKQLMDNNKIDCTKEEETGTTIYIAVDNKFKGSILISDKIKKDSYKAVGNIKKYGIKDIFMLTGDKDTVAKKVSEELGITKYYAGLLPTDKVEIINKLLENKSNTKKLLFIGDGINDAPVLASADIGVSLGGAGSDAAIEASDIVLMTDEISKIVDAINISKKTIRIVKENIIFAIGVKILVLVLSAFGIASMWSAVFADVGVSVIAILNALRVLSYKSKN